MEGVAAAVEEPAAAVEEGPEAPTPESTLDSLEEATCQAVLAMLLAHPNEVVRLAAEEAVQQASQKCIGNAANVSAVDVDMVEVDVSDSGDGFEEVSPPKDFEFEESLTEEKEVAPKLSASVVSSVPLVLGIEAQEDSSAQGDITQELAEAVRDSGAHQAWRIGRIVVPVGTDLPVPACVKAVVVNDGEVPWPETTVVTIVAGDALDFPELALGAIKPGEAAQVLMDLTVPPAAEPGTARSTWTIADSATGATLGSLLLFEVVWMEQ